MACYFTYFIVSAYLGFSCPPEAKNFLGAENTFYRSQTDCQKYYVCINDKPRLLNCGEGRAFNDIINSCDGIENVTSCAIGGRKQNKQGSFFK